MERPTTPIKSRRSNLSFLFFGLLGGVIVLSGLTKDGPYLADYHGQPYIQYPVLLILLGGIMVVLSAFLWWRYVKRGQHNE